jgi:hypothetical protein
MSGVFDSPAARESQEIERAETAARRRAQRLADEQESAKVAGRIRADYEERLASPQFLEEAPAGSGFLPPYPWMEG